MAGGARKHLLDRSRPPPRGLAVLPSGPPPPPGRCDVPGAPRAARCPRRVIGGLVVPAATQRRILAAIAGGRGGHWLLTQMVSSPDGGGSDSGAGRGGTRRVERDRAPPHGATLFRARTPGTRPPILRQPGRRLRFASLGRWSGLQAASKHTAIDPVRGRRRATTDSGGWMPGRGADGAPCALHHRCKVRCPPGPPHGGRHDRRGVDQSYN
jgi:hypothetical protein